MIRVKSIRLTGSGQPDAVIAFDTGSNILAGESERGKSLIVACLDYILGADKMTKRVPKMALYSQLLVEFENNRGEILTLRRSLAGGDLVSWPVGVERIAGAGSAIVPRRRGRSKAADVASVLFPFARVPEAQLRKNVYGEVGRLTARLMVPALLADEVSIISEMSPILGKAGYDETTRRRMFALMLTGRDDEGLVAAERRELTVARLNARLGLVDELLTPLEKRFAASTGTAPEESIERLEGAIARISEEHGTAGTQADALRTKREVAVAAFQKAENQLVAIGELLKRYELLVERYASDLQRLDFVAEGSYFFDALQHTVCPLCDQIMGAGHMHTAHARSAEIYQAARSEAGKIRVQQKDLEAAIGSLLERRQRQTAERDTAVATRERIDTDLRLVLAPQINFTAARLEELINRRIVLEAERSERDQWVGLCQLKAKIELAARQERAPTQQWEELPPIAVRSFCSEVEAVLIEWNWKKDVRVSFDEDTFDINVDGQPRQSHGKGVRAILYSAFVIALLRYCKRAKTPHLGFVVIDSPLTSYKKGKDNMMRDGPIDAGIEAGFWNSLVSVPDDVQIIVIENKEPPTNVSDAIHFEWFHGEDAGPDERKGFIP